MTVHSRDRLEGVLLGTAVGDALGLPREGLSPGRARRMFGGTLEHRFLFGRGMLSDDTEHTCIVAQAFLSARGDLARFERTVGWRLRGWLLGLPAGVGMGTARAILKLWLGFPPSSSGVRSAGNGPAMRCGILGLLIDDTAELVRWVRAATRVTHTDPRAERGALLVALAIRHGARDGPVDADRFLEEIAEHVDDELRRIMESLRTHLANASLVADFAADLGLCVGVSGYAYHTVPVALYAWLRHPEDLRAAVSEAIALGGDADTVGAVTGAICGATTGASGIPVEWIDGICDAPRSVSWIRRLAGRIVEKGGPLPLAWPLLPLRNLAFLGVVLLHGFRRLLPPYTAGGT